MTVGTGVLMPRSTRSLIALAFGSHSSAVAIMSNEAATTPVTTRPPGKPRMLRKPMPTRRSSGMARNIMRVTVPISQSRSTSRSTHFSRFFFSSASR